MNYFIKATNEVIEEFRRNVSIGIKEIKYTNMNIFLRICIVYKNKNNKIKSISFYYNAYLTRSIELLKNEFKEFLKYNLKGEVDEN